MRYLILHADMTFSHTTELNVVHQECAVAIVAVPPAGRPYYIKRVNTAIFGIPDSTGLEKAVVSAVEI